jgi:hypothetical protein
MGAASFLDGYQFSVPTSRHVSRTRKHLNAIQLLYQKGDFSHAWTKARFLEEIRNSSNVDGCLLHAAYRRPERRQADGSQGPSRSLHASRQTDRDSCRLELDHSHAQEIGSNPPSWGISSGGRTIGRRAAAPAPSPLNGQTIGPCLKYQSPPTQQTQRSRSAVVVASR